MKNAGIYIIGNTINGKEYVGKDSRLPKRINEHLRGKCRCPAIHNAIKKHGRDNFTVEIIRYPNVPHQILCWFERSHIAERNSKRPNGYNLTDGGDGSFGYNHSPDTKVKMSESQRGKKVSLETRAKMSKVKCGNTNRLGKKHTAESRAKMSKAKCGSRNSNYGKTPSVETRAKIAKSLRQASYRKKRETRKASGQGTLF